MDMILSFPKQVKQSGSLEICRDVPHAFSSNTSEARGLKFGRYNPHIDGSKVTNQIVDILPKSWDI